MHSLPTRPGATARPHARSFSLIAFAIALSCLATNAFAQEDLLVKASALLGKKDAAGAYALLAQAETTRAGDPAFDYLLGIAALDSGHVTRAIFALERLMQRQPDNLLAHAELGRAYLAAGDPDSARVEMRLARGGDLPEGASAAIDRVIGVIDQLARPTGPRVSGYLEVGAGYDSNVNSATNQGEFAIPAFGGILFQTAPESRQQHDLVASAAGGINAEFALSPAWKLVAAGNLRGTVDRVVHDMNTVLFDATVGARRTVGTQSQTIALQNGTAWVGSSRYRSANGISAQWQQQLNAASQASLFGQWSHQDYKGQAERNTDRSLLGIGFGREFAAAGTLVYGSAYFASERATKAELAHFGHHASGLRLGMERRLNPSVMLFAEGQHERRRFGGTEPFFDTDRRDHQNYATAGLRYSATDQWQLTAQVHHTRAASNVVLYDYSRSVIQITAHRTFP
ncbi:surface lipoprotein assembly modifier [Roseateles sp.]|uniref:surface lipoprotein assembly modifier n=1 Tax=Roseateles sp. TaxID=1971397 RepID=UPI00286AD03C|nr:surface lipoprotein assembly modifier [Roseateles sp.]